MSRTPIIAGNWKMFKTAGEATAFVAEVKGKAEVAGVESVAIRAHGPMIHGAEEDGGKPPELRIAHIQHGVSPSILPMR